MTARPTRRDPGQLREILIVSALTITGAGLRLWQPARLGMVHFDEGVYALAGLWALSDRGLEGFDPAVIVYAPPGFPVLVGLSYLCLGVSDFSAIAVSILCGTLTIPAAGWLAGRTFGRGAGATASALAAFSGPHVAFSRMALTDAPFLLLWILALGQGQRFLARPNVLRALALGLAVGVAQLFKYSGWVSGLIVALGAGLAPVCLRERRSLTQILLTWGWGLGALLLAALVYWPYFRFVQSHGGYLGLLAHQQSYTSGISSWAPHFWHQLQQARALSGGPSWLAAGGLAGALGMALCCGDFGSKNPFRLRSAPLTLILAAICILPELRWLVPVGWVYALLLPGLGAASSATCLLAAGWLTLAILTPFYHPYARLWLPMEAFAWVFLGGLFVSLRSAAIAGRSTRRAETELRPGNHPTWLGVCVICAALFLSLTPSWWKSRFGAILGPSDSLRLACDAITRELPDDVRTLSYLGRPPAVFYLSLTGAAVVRHPDYDQFLRAADATSWAVLDLSLLRQNGALPREMERLNGRFVVVRSFRDRLNLPTLLDIDPSAAGGGPIDLAGSLLLLRPRRAGEIP
jgi:4-amino-4-deoxy-L-arabinose transferase-like glycosyltransferase